MHKFSLIPFAMLVSYAISPLSEASDNTECLLNRQEPIYDNTPLQSPSPSRISGIQSLRTTVNDGLDAHATSTALVPIIAMVKPAYAQDNLIKALSGWQSVINVVLATPVNTRSARVGDIVESRLALDFRFGPQLIAARDSLVRGHVTEAESARTLTHSALSSDRRLKSRGILAIQFDEIIDQSGYHWPIQATPTPRQKSQHNLDRSRVRSIETDANGSIIKAEAELAGGLKATSNAAKIATMVPLPGTFLFTSLAPAVAMGAVGAASPSIAYDKPIDANTEHRRTKGAVYGFMSNLPGAIVVKSIVEKGNEIELEPGDQLTLNCRIKDTGYRLPPEEQLTVKGKVIMSPALKQPGVNGTMIKPQQSRRLYPAAISQQSRLVPSQ